MRRWTVCLALLVLLGSFQSGSPHPRNRPSARDSGVDDHVRLLKTLLNDSVYPEHTRPTKDQSKPTPVKFGLELNAIIDLDEPKQLLKTQVTVILNWIDEYLSWDTHDFAVPEMRIPSSKLWLPDVTLRNSADSVNFMLEDRQVRVKPSGEIEFRAFIVITSFCKINFAFFPYDEQSCQLKFRAWTYPREQVIFIPGDEFNANDTEEHGEWMISEMKGKVEEYDEDHGSFSDFVVSIALIRRPQFYVMNIIVPCLIIYCLTLFSFCLPCDSGEKIGLGITILLSLTVFMLISADMMPPTSDNFPLIGQFYTATMVLVAASVGMSVMVLNFNHRPPGARRAPEWMRRLLLQSRCSKCVSLRGMQSFNVMRATNDTEQPTGVVTYTLSPSAKTTKSSCISEDYSAGGDDPAPEAGTPGMVRYPSSPKLGRPVSRDRSKEQVGEAGETGLQTTLDIVSPLGAPRQDGAAHGASPALERLLTNISGDLKKLVEHKEEEKEEEAIVDEWKLLAKAVDRIFLFMFVGASILLTVVLGSEMLRR
ncbi:neuronal acetylcholine receptor subunit beta-2-like [Patiria miniata]|uniref:Uncharacterized protein n=1 Tax=Patiria miniata TaxID=46514 RepID=A0A914B4J4_PATMI|nr:neuronal acetylcholine receptor subunit beta-2-like [Patiria miniata]